MESHKIELIGQAIGGGIVGALGFVWIAHLGNDGSMHPAGFGGALFGSVFGAGSGRWGIPVAVLFGGFVGFLCG